MSALALEAAPDPLIGKTLQERYRVVRKLGEGGMGAVYEGEHLVIKKRVAIKLLHPHFATSPEIVARFHQEALAATAIGHEHIVEVNDMGRTPEGAIFMVLEFLAGTDFAGLLEKEGRLPIGRVARIVSQVCSGVQAAHDKGIVHRDLKPENVFLIRRGADPDFVKVLDFGISKFADADTGGARAATKTGSILGTAYYMSPEQAQGKKSVDHRTDVWAMGVILYRALTGRYPFDDEAYPMLVIRIITETAAPVRSHRPDVPEALGALIAQCLERDVQRRVQSCNELRERLAPFVHMDAAPPVQSAVAFAPTVVSTVPTPAPSPGGVSSGTRELVPATPASSHIRSVASPTSRAPLYGGVAVLGVIAAAALAGGAVWLNTTTSEPPATIAPLETSALAATGLVAPTAPPAPVELLEFIVSPSEAVVLIDGRPLSPAPGGVFTHEIDPDDVALHELRVESRGFRTRIEDIRLSYRQRIVVGLDPGTGIDDRRGEAAPVAEPQEPERHVHGTSRTHAVPRGSEAREGSPTVATTTLREDPPPTTQPVAVPTTSAPPPPVTAEVTTPPRSELRRVVIP